MATPFKPSRNDGRSDRQIIYDLTQDAEPGATFTYQELITALQAGLEKPIERDRVYRAVGVANNTLLREHQRYLSVVANVGYRVIRSDEHASVAIRRQSRIRTQAKRGKDVLTHTRLGDLDPVQLDFHERLRMGMSLLSAAVDHLDQRQRRSESLIEDLLKKGQDVEHRLGRLEGDEPA